MIKYFLCFLVAFIFRDITKEIFPKMPKCEDSNPITKLYKCPICGETVSYFWYNYNVEEDDSETNPLFEIRCSKYCSTCGTRLNYKAVNNQHKIVYKKSLFCEDSKSEDNIQ